MKRLIIGFVLALSLMVGAAGSALATNADSAACDNANFAGITNGISLVGCSDHP